MDLCNRGQAALSILLRDPMLEMDRIVELRSLLHNEPERVIRNAYRRGDSGCILNVLMGAATRGARLTFFGERIGGAASEMVIMEWDAGRLTCAHVLSTVEAFLETRRVTLPPEADPATPSYMALAT